jgi:hypothetical protein
LAEKVPQAAGVAAVQSQFTLTRRMAEHVGVSRTRVGHFLSLDWLPVDTKAKLKAVPDFTEYQVRRILKGQAPVLGN